MIIKILKYLAVCLLVLLCAMSTMGDSKDDYKYYISQSNSSLCLSFKNNRLTDCCKADEMQQIYVKKTGPATGIYYVKNYFKVLCFDERKNKFRLYRRKRLRLCNHRHQRRKELRRHGRRRLGDCKPTDEDVERLRLKGCELHETMRANGFTLLSFDKQSRYLGLRRGKVHKLKRWRDGTWREPRTESRIFLASSEGSFKKILRSVSCS